MNIDILSKIVITYDKDYDKIKLLKLWEGRKGIIIVVWAYQESLSLYNRSGTVQAISQNIWMIFGLAFIFFPKFLPNLPYLLRRKNLQISPALYYQ